MVMKCSTKNRHGIVGNGHTLLEFLPYQVGKELKDSCNFHEGRVSVYWFKASDEVQGKETRRFSSEVNERQKNMSLLHEVMMEILRPLPEAGSASLEVKLGGKDVLHCFEIVMFY